MVKQIYSPWEIYYEKEKVIPTVNSFLLMVGLWLVAYSVAFFFISESFALLFLTEKISRNKPVLNCHNSVSIHIRFFCVCGCLPNSIVPQLVKQMRLFG